MVIYYYINISWSLAYYFVCFLFFNLQNDLSKKFKVSGIPTLVFVDGMTGKLLTVDGRSIVVEDTEGKDFPWSPKKFTEVIPGDFVDKEENKTIWDDIKADVIGLYFSAHWVRKWLCSSFKKLDCICCVLMLRIVS